MEIPELNLWQAVLKEAVIEGDEGYFKLDNRNFRFVCSMANVDPHYFIENYKKLNLKGRIQSDRNRDKSKV